MSTSKPYEFERNLKELEAITAWFESTEADLDEGIAKFERGMELAQELKGHLAAVENRVEKIRQRFSAGAEAKSPTDPTDEPTSDPQSDTSQAGLFGS
jgi:exodeoxyribonuclease VII small subunit